MKEVLEKLQKEFGNRIWTSPIKNQFVKYNVYFDSYIIGQSDTSYEMMRNNINHYI